MTPFTLVDFVRESNRIEGIVREPRSGELAAHERFLDAPAVTISLLQDFVAAIQPGATLRDRTGMNVSVGQHRPVDGGPEVARQLDALLQGVCREPLIVAPWRSGYAFTRHCEYETLHPFMDGNGRSGRVLWLWMMGGIDRAPLGFLHTWYYQSLQSGTAREGRRGT